MEFTALVRNRRPAGVPGGWECPASKDPVFCVLSGLSQLTRALTIVPGRRRRAVPHPLVPPFFSHLADLKPFPQIPAGGCTTPPAWASFGIPWPLVGALMTRERKGERGHDDRDRRPLTTLSLPCQWQPVITLGTMQQFFASSHRLVLVPENFKARLPRFSLLGCFPWIYPGPQTDS